MNQILSYPLWIGHGGEGHNFPLLFEAGIEAVIELAVEEPALPTSRDLISCRLPLYDGVGNRPEVLVLAIRTAATLIESKIPTLVCCSNGMSRSPAVVAAALALVTHNSLEKCLKEVTFHHPSDVSPGLWKDLTELPHELLEVGHLTGR